MLADRHRSIQAVKEFVERSSPRVGYRFDELFNRRWQIENLRSDLLSTADLFDVAEKGFHRS